MNNREKKAWIIRYAKKHGFEDVLNDKYSNKKESILKRYSDEIQVICSLLSVLFIGFSSLIVSFKSNEIAERQLEISKYESRPILSVSLERDSETGLDYLSIINTGKAPVNFYVDVTSYFECFANENHFGSIPIRAYTLYSIESLKTNSANSTELAELVLYNSFYPTLRNLDDEFETIVHSFTNYAWAIRHTYLIRIDYVDILNEKNFQYFICDTQGARSISTELGQQIYDECNYMESNGYGSYTSRETYYDFKNVTAEQIFSVTLGKMRANNLYLEADGSHVLYGEFEPNIEKEQATSQPTDEEIVNQPTD